MRSNTTSITKEAIGLLRKQRKTYQEIGDVFGVPRQRIHQIYKGYRSVYKDEWKKKKHRKEPKFFKYRRVLKKCQNCQKEFEITNSIAKRRKYCSVKCYWNYYGYPKSEEEKKIHSNEWQRKYYHRVIKKDPFKLAKAKRANKESYLKLRNDPKRWNEYLRKKLEKYHNNSLINTSVY